MTWRDVPMPPQIARLERDPRGYPIPYIAQRYPLLVPPPVDPVPFKTEAEANRRLEGVVEFGQCPYEHSVEEHR